MDYNKVVGIYLKIRQKRKELKERFEAEDKALKADLTRIENTLLNHLNETNVDSMKTEAGTFYKQEEITPTGSDWEAFYDWVAENNAFDALERRIKKTFVSEYMEAHEGGVPPGVSVFREYVVRIRKS
jgi:hypothetical protein